jgi:CRP-like cAMP-binding protein
VFGGAAVFLLKNSTFLTASAIAAAAVGFALQDTLANAFAGLAIQIEKPFRVGHWINVANYEGAVAEVTWRATKIRTEVGNLVVIPNNVVAREAIHNYSAPSTPTRVFVEVGAAYAVPPNETRDAMFAAMRQVSRVLASPPPEVHLREFGASALVFRARFWIADFGQVEYAQDEVRRAIYYEFARRHIEIPWPIQVEYSRHDAPTDREAVRDGFARTIAATSVFSALPPDAHGALSDAAEEHVYGDGEVIVREGEEGRSMFLVRRGRVAVTVGGASEDRGPAREVAVIGAGGYFGEMSLLTGDRRSATVHAKGDCTVLEIGAPAFGAYIRSKPEVVELLAAAAEQRRRELNASRTEAVAPPSDTRSLADRIRRFFGLIGT